MRTTFTLSVLIDEETATGSGPISRVELRVLGNSTRYSGHSLLLVDGQELGPVACIAICRPVDHTETLLVHCDLRWNPLGAASYKSLSEPKKKAGRIYRGRSAHCICITTGITGAKAKHGLQEHNRCLRYSFCGKGPEEVLPDARKKHGSRVRQVRSQILYNASSIVVCKCIHSFSVPQCPLCLSG